MNSGRPKFWKLRTLAILLALFSLGLACTPEPYGPCTLPSSQAMNEACSASGGDDNTTAAASCVVDFVFECESQLCSTYQGSAPFCTVRCTDPADASCPKVPETGVRGSCVEWIPGLGEYYCVPAE